MSVVGATSFVDSVVQCPVGFNVLGAPYLLTTQSYIPDVAQSAVTLQTALLGCLPCSSFTYTRGAGSSVDLRGNQSAVVPCQLCPPGGYCLNGANALVDHGGRGLGSLRRTLESVRLSAGSVVLAGTAQPSMQYWGTVGDDNFTCQFELCPTGMCSGSTLPPSVVWPPLLSPAATSSVSVFLNQAPTLLTNPYYVAAELCGLSNSCGSDRTGRLCTR